MALGETKDPNSTFPNSKETELAKEARDKLVPLFQKKESIIEFEIIKGNGEKEKIQVPSTAFVFFFEILKQMANGNTVTVIPQHAQLTTQEAANFLNVSRPFLIKLLEKEKIPYKKVGSHRRIKFVDILKYKNALMDESKKIREDLTNDAQNLDLGY